MGLKIGKRSQLISMLRSRTFLMGLLVRCAVMLVSRWRASLARTAMWNSVSQSFQRIGGFAVVWGLKTSRPMIVVLRSDPADCAMLWSKRSSVLRLDLFR